MWLSQSLKHMTASAAVSVAAVTGHPAKDVESAAHL